MKEQQRKIKEMSRAFKGIWIPATYWLDDNLKMTEIFLISEINSLDNGQGCFASNNYLADFMGVTASWVSRTVTSLKNKGYITVNYERDGKAITKRIIRVVGNKRNQIVSPLREFPLIKLNNYK